VDHPALQPIVRSPLYETIVDRLRRFIDVEQLQPGDRLMSERQLADQLGVSRHSVRQALTALRVMGMVEIRHGDGVYLLRPPNDVIPNLAQAMLDSEVDHPMIWEVREGVEVQAARLAARRRTPDDLSAMESAIDAMARSVADGGDGIAGDSDFHRALADASHNPLLRRLVDEIAEAIDRTSEASLTIAGRPPVSLDAHRRILGAIRDGDEARAADEMHDHIAVSGRSVYSPGSSGT
jgi:GntR family transcriptional repressor for pyruvate dehydrogenase complex